MKAAGYSQRVGIPKSSAKNTLPLELKMSPQKPLVSFAKKLLELNFLT
jgi:hypothetical protein